MKSSIRLSLVALSGAWLCMVSPALAQTGLVIPPGVPEPGLVIWGAVVNATNTSLPVPIASASWSVTDGAKAAVYTASSKPSVRIVTLGNQSYYILEVPFDTRRFGTVTLADPATEGIDSFELRGALPPTYTLTPTINGMMATVHAIDGAPASGANVAVPGFTTALRGLVRRVDLAVLPSADNYEAWATAIFGSPGHPDAGRNADPDGDGFTNDREFAAGTDPKSASSLLRLLTISVTQGQATVGWQSVANKNYVIEAASAVEGPWFSVGAPVSSSGTSTQTSVNRNAAETLKFYRIRVLSP